MKPIINAVSSSLLAATVAAILAVAYACSQVSFASSEELAISVTTETHDVELGRGFPVTVVRTWGNSIDPQPFNERALAPLVMRLESTSLRESDSQVEETRRYLAYAFTLDPVVVPGVLFEGRYGYLHDWSKTAKSAPLHLRVKTALDPRSPGAPEGPGDMLPSSMRWLIWSLGAAALVGVAFLAWRQRRRVESRTPVPPPIPVGPGPDVEALARLAALRVRAGAGADIIEASDVVRTYAARRFDVPALEMTSGELLVSLAQAGAGLRAVFDPSDLVKFADHAPTAEERIRALDSAEAFVLATKSAP